MLKLIYTLAALALVQHGQGAPTSAPPKAHASNGTYIGVHSQGYKQDFFLGVPFAQPPVDDLRLRRPQSLNESWTGNHDATAYGPACIGYGPDSLIGANNYESEDCLTLNIVRPSGFEHCKLPVGVWIYGGGYYEGSSLDPRYNLSFIVEQSVLIDKPIIGVSINYRLQGWGWLWSKEIVDAGVANLGLYDQRMALTWLKENIAAFGGNGNVTIWGESAGALSVGQHILAYNGRDDGLFSGAIAESGAQRELIYDNVVNKTGCADAADKLDCLRKLPLHNLNSTFAALVDEPYHRVNFGPLIDGDIVQRGGFEQMLSGHFVRVPYILGENSDDGTDFPPFGINTDADFTKFFSAFGWDKKTETRLQQLYPPHKDDYIPQSWPGNFNSSIGLQFKRASTLIGDLFFKAPRRLCAHLWAQQTRTPLYSYRFNAISNSDAYWEGVTHWTEVPFVFHNTIDGGQGFTNISVPPYFGAKPFVNRGAAYFELVDLTSRMWASFIHDGNPNYHGQRAVSWPAYSTKEPTNFVFDANRSSYVEPDTYRPLEIGYLMEKYRAREGVWAKHDMS